MQKNNKFLVIGLGSMGKRRIRNLIFNGETEIIGFDPDSIRCKEVAEEYKIKTLNTLKDLSHDKYDAIIISTPPNLHGEYIKKAIKENKHFFVEIGTSDEGYKEATKNTTSEKVWAPSCTMVFYRPIKMIKEVLESGRIGKVLAFQYHMGQYLPDWHPWEDYRDVYFSKKETGACREMFPFELIWINDVLNDNVKKVCGITNKVSDLDMDADDLLLGQLEYKNGIKGNIIIDVISRKPYRTLRVLGSEGTLDWERFDSTIKVYNSKTKQTEVIDVPKGNPEKGYVNEEEMYNDEIGCFLGAIEGKVKYPHTFADSERVLQVLYALEKSSNNGKAVLLSD